MTDAVARRWLVLLCLLAPLALACVCRAVQHGRQYHVQRRAQLAAEAATAGLAHAWEALGRPQPECMRVALAQAEACLADSAGRIEPVIDRALANPPGFREWLATIADWRDRLTRAGWDLRAVPALGFDAWLAAGGRIWLEHSGGTRRNAVPLAGIWLRWLAGSAPGSVHAISTQAADAAAAGGMLLDCSAPADRIAHLLGAVADEPGVELRRLSIERVGTDATLRCQVQVHAMPAPAPANIAQASLAPLDRACIDTRVAFAQRHWAGAWQVPDHASADGAPAQPMPWHAWRLLAIEAATSPWVVLAAWEEDGGERVVLQDRRSGELFEGGPGDCWPAAGVCIGPFLAEEGLLSITCVADGTVLRIGRQPVPNGHWKATCVAPDGTVHVLGEGDLFPPDSGTWRILALDQDGIRLRQNKTDAISTRIWHVAAP